MIDHERKFIFIHLPKTGGNSVKKALGIKGHKHTNLSYWSKDYPDYFSFAFTRNPWDRCVSAFTYLEAGGMNPGDKKEYYTHIHGLKFHEFISKYQDTFEIPMTHFKSQDMILDGDLDFIGKVENYQEDFNTVCDKIGVERVELGWKNKTEHKHYTKYYSDKTKRIVAKLYANDIERFGYKFGE